MVLLELARHRLRDRRVVAVLSGKGGVGKSVVSALLALTAPRKTILLDLDVHGMAAKELFSVERNEVTRDGIEPVWFGHVGVVTLGGIVGDRAVVLPGSSVGNVMEGLIAHTNYGDAEYVVIDAPPGLSDELHVIMRTASSLEPIIVTTPSRQSLWVVKHLVEYLVDAGRKPRVMVVNMSYAKCDGNILRVFGGVDAAKSFASSFGMSIVEVPIDPSIEDFVGRLHEYRGALLSSIREVWRLI